MYFISVVLLETSLGGNNWLYFIFVVLFKTSLCGNNWLYFISVVLFKTSLCRNKVVFHFRCIVNLFLLSLLNFNRFVMFLSKERKTKKIVKGMSGLLK